MGGDTLRVYPTARVLGWRVVSIDNPNAKREILRGGGAASQAVQAASTSGPSIEPFTRLPYMDTVLQQDIHVLDHDPIC